MSLLREYSLLIVLCFGNVNLYLGRTWTGRKFTSAFFCPSQKYSEAYSWAFPSRFIGTVLILEHPFPEIYSLAIQIMRLPHQAITKSFTRMLIVHNLFFQLETFILVDQGTPMHPFFMSVYYSKFWVRFLGKIR